MVMCSRCMRPIVKGAWAAGLSSTCARRVVEQQIIDVPRPSTSMNARVGSRNDSIW